MQNVLFAVFAHFFFLELWVWTKSSQRKLSAAQLYSWFHLFYLCSAHSTIEVISRCKVKTENNQSTLCKYLATAGRKGKKKTPLNWEKTSSRTRLSEGQPSATAGWGMRGERDERKEEQREPTNRTKHKLWGREDSKLRHTIAAYKCTGGESHESGGEILCASWEIALPPPARAG